MGICPFAPIGRESLCSNLKFPTCWWASAAFGYYLHWRVRVQLFEFIHAYTVVNQAENDRMHASSWRIRLQVSQSILRHAHLAGGGSGGLFFFLIWMPHVQPTIYIHAANALGQSLIFLLSSRAFCVYCQKLVSLFGNCKGIPFIKAPVENRTLFALLTILISIVRASFVKNPASPWEGLAWQPESPL